MKTIDDNRRAIILLMVGMFFISINDMLIKYLADDYPLHQIVFIRSLIGISASVVVLQLEGGWRLLKTNQLGLHGVRAGLIVLANMTFFAALAVMPLGAATALFFVSPLFITLLAIPVLGETVGPHRLIAIGIGFVGVLVMMAPGIDWGDIGRVSLILPVLAALCYAGTNVLTRKLGAQSAASAMAIYIQGAFILVSFVFFLIAGDGRFMPYVNHDSLVFLLRSWVWPAPQDWGPFAMIGLCSAAVGYTLSRAYKIGVPATVAPYEYTLLPIAVFWGWFIFGEVPGPWMIAGMVLIVGAGLYVFARERRQAASVTANRPFRRG